MAKRQRQSFSRRHGYQGESPPIAVWEDAPQDFRFAVLQIANEDCQLSPSRLRDIICRGLRKRPNPNNWSEYPNIWDEVQSLFLQCHWYRVYDIIELLAEDLDRKHVSSRGQHVMARDIFEEEVNLLLVEFGIGWKLEDGLVQARGEDSYEAYLKAAEDALEEAEKPTALTELKEAIQDISRRPEPDTSGAIQHAMAALECVARGVSGNSKPTLGKLMQRHPDLFPKPVDNAVEKLWGYASENARHGREGNAPTREEAMLIVGISVTLVNYLIHKSSE